MLHGGAAYPSSCLYPRIQYSTFTRRSTTCTILVSLPIPKPRLIQFWSLLLQASFLLEHSLLILMNYKQRNKRYFCRGGHPTPPQSTIRDQAHFSAGPTRRVFRPVQRTEFPRLDQRKVNPLLCTLQGF
jgi:hypothetical protein